MTAGYVYVIDDDDSLRQSLLQSLLRRGYGAYGFSSAEEFLQNPLTEDGPSVLLLDVRMNGLNGIELQEKLSFAEIQVPIVFMSGECNSKEVIHALRGRPIEFLWKPFSVDQMLEAIEVGLTTNIQQRELSRKLSVVSRAWTTLTQREKEVSLLMLQGYSNKEMASMLDILPDTAKKHRAQVFLKFEVDKLSDLIKKCAGINLQELAP